ncbi:MAG: hypothetical protein RL616_1806 [Verrucomicrobiota bacterium]|jgi:uncharacterized protein YrrD
MSHSLKQLNGKKLDASDGEIGQVKDFYFDDQSWAVRYVVAETGTWLTSRQVLLSPRAFGSLFPDGRDLIVNLTRQQIEDSPPIEWHKPVSRQYEEEYHRYYGWPNYWEGDGLLGTLNNFPILEVPEKNPSNVAAAIAKKAKSPDAHLRSTQAVKGYHLQATDGIIGHVHDFMMDEESWVIGELVIKTGSRFSGHEVLIPVSKVIRISYEESTVFVSLTKEAVAQSPAQQLALDGVFA